MGYKIYVIVFVFIINVTANSFGQNINADTTGVDVKANIENGDTVYSTTMEPVYIYSDSEITPEQKEEIKKYQRLVRNVKKAYPYAQLVKKNLDEINNYLMTLKTDKEKKVYINQKEKELKEKFEDQLKNLTVTQGRILIKLIDRETGNTTYVLVKQLKGTLSAVFWQSIARIFGSNLKMKYDAEGVDKDIEYIVKQIEAGKM
jgi:hypothetical protein